MAVAVAHALSKYPPRGGVALLDRRHTQGERSALERLVAEEYVIDTIKAFDGSRCAERALDWVVVEVGGWVGGGLRGRWMFMLFMLAWKAQVWAYRVHLYFLDSAA